MTAEFMQEKFGDMHAQAFNGKHKVSTSGYPDTGNGVYAKALPYKAWVEFNTSQRAHLNMSETILPVIFWTLIGGLQYPVESSALSVIYLLGRLLYAKGMTGKSADGRFPGFLLSLLS